MKSKLTTITWLSMFGALISWGAYVGGYIFLNDRLDSITTLRTEIETHTARVERYKEIEEAQSVSLPLVTKLDEHIVGSSEESLADFLGFVERLAKESGVKIHISSLGRDDGSSNNLIETLTLTLSVEGSWSSWFNFLRMIEELPYDVSISKVAVSTSPKETSTNNAWFGTLDFTVKAFSSK